MCVATLNFEFAVFQFDFCVPLNEVCFSCLLNCRPSGGHYLLLEAKWPCKFKLRFEGSDTPTDFGHDL